jgi:maltokinase
MELYGTLRPVILEPALSGLDLNAILGARWFAGKGARIERVRRLAVVSPPGAAGFLAVLAIRTSDGVEDLYTFPGELAGEELRESADPGLWRALFELAAGGGTIEGDGCRLHGMAGPAAAGQRASELDVRPLGADQSHTTFVLGGSYALKCYRRLAPGPHPEIELTRTLTAAGFAHIPAVQGSAILDLDGQQFGLLHLQAYLPGAEDGFAVARRELGARSPIEWAAACGRVLAELHGVLAEELGSEPATDAALERWRGAAVAQLEQAERELDGPGLAALRSARPRLDALLDRLGPGEPTDEPALVCRIHGDVHIGQFLRDPDGRLAIIDFEGEPGRSTDERREPASPMRDLATLLRSFDHAGFWVESVQPAAAPDVEFWISAAREACVRGYREASAGAGFAPRLLAALEAEKAVKELLYAQRFVPDWMKVAVSGLRRLCR